MSRNDMDGTRQGVVELSRRGIIKAVAGTGFALSAASGSAFATTGTDQVVVRAEEVDPGVLPLGAGVIDELRATAAQSQAPIVDWAEDADGVAVANQFWLANALLLDIDTDRVDIEEILAVEGVSRIHPNFEVEIPEPEGEHGGGDSTYGLEQIRVLETWAEFETRGDGARISVLDTGIDPDHPDLDIEDEHFEEFDGDGDPVGSDPHDSHYHGTHVSGTVVGPEEPAGDLPAYGVAPEATLMHGLVLPGGGGTFAQIVGGMEWSVENDADAINMSLGATGYFTEMIEPVRNAELAGTLVVAASGNLGLGTSSSPGNVYDAVAVGASDEDEEIADFSSGEAIETADAWGPAAPGDWPEEYVVPDVSGPGVDVLSAIPDGESVPFTDCGVGDIYCAISGTSMASPHVAGLVGLMRSAEVEDFALDQVKAALTTTAWKPADEPVDPDPRYGSGIVDALHATSRVAAASGVEGSVVDGEADGDEPIAGAEVDLDGFPVTSGADGEYRIRALAGEYDVTASAFGFGTQTEEAVEVEDDEFTTLDFALERVLDVDLVGDQPDVIEAPDEFDVVLRVANLDRLTVELAGTFEGEAGLEVDGEMANFGEPVDFDEPVTDTITLTVIVGEDGQGGLELQLTLEWTDRGQTLELTTGPTEIVEEIVDVAVVDREDGAFGDQLVAAIDAHIHPRFAPELVPAADALAAAENDEYGAYVVQHLGDDLDAVADFAAETAGSDVGVVWLDQFGDESMGIPQLAAATGDPGATFQAESVAFFPPFDPSVYYHVERGHATVDSVGEAGDAVAVTTPPVFVVGFWFVAEFHSYFEDYDGRVAGDTIAGVDPGSFAFDPEDALAVDDLRSTVLASSLGMGTLVQRDDFEDAGEEILANATEVAASTPLVRDVSVPPDRIDPGTAAGWTFEVDDLLEVELSLVDALGIDGDDFQLLVNEEEAAFDEPIEFDEPLDELLSITLDALPDTFGRFSLRARFRNLNRFGEEETLTVTFRPVSVYDPPVLVPDDTADVQLAVDVVAPGEQIFLDDGTYEVDEPDRGFQAGLYIGTPDITISALADATPEIIHGRDLPAPRIIDIDADGVTLEGIHANVVDGEADERNWIGSGMIVNDFTSGVTVRDCTVAGVFGIQFGAPISDVHIEDVTAIETVIGVGTDSGTFGEVADATITGVTVTDRPAFTFRGGVIVDSGATRVSVTDCHIEMEAGENGVVLEGPFAGGEDCVVANNTIVGEGIDEADLGFTITEAGVLIDRVEAVIEHNEITDTGVGVHVGDRFGFGDEPVVVRHNEIDAVDFGYRQTGEFATVERNVIGAPVGMQLGEDPDEIFPRQIDEDQILARFNDLSGSDVPLVGVPDEPFFAPPEHLIFDCRQNYLGDRGYDDTIAEGDIEYEPFLTAPPDEIDLSQPTELGVDLYLHADETYGLGVPGPCDQTIWDVLGVEEGGGHDEFEGDVYRWQRDNQRGRNGGRWHGVTGRGSLSDKDTLAGFKVEPDEGVRAVLHFQSMADAADAPPGRRDRDLGEITVDEGTHVVCAPAYGDEAVFADGTAEIASVESKELQPPGRQLSEWQAEDEPKQPFSAYYVEVTGAGTIEGGLDEYDPTMDEIYEAFGLDPVIHADPGAGAAATTALELTVEDVLAVVPEGDVEDALYELAGHRLDAATTTDATAREQVVAMGEVGDSMIEDAPEAEEERVMEAVREAIATAIQDAFDCRVVLDPEADDAAALPDAVEEVMAAASAGTADSTQPAAADD